MFSTGEILTLCSLAMVLIFNIISQWRMSSASAHADTEQITKLSVKIEEVISGIKDIKTEIKDMKSDIRTDHDKIIIMERDIKSLWKTVGGKKGEDNEN
jgi:peptidoglycan hydrolase CwlO-like protein